jgi:hypothetical protein
MQRRVIVAVAMARFIMMLAPHRASDQRHKRCVRPATLSPAAAVQRAIATARFPREAGGLW